MVARGTYNKRHHDERASLYFSLIFIFLTRSLCHADARLSCVIIIPRDPLDQQH